MAREITTQRELATAVGETADTTDQIRDLLEERSTGEGSEMERFMEEIANLLESFDQRLLRIEDALNISGPAEGEH